MYKILAYSAWKSPQEFWAESEEEMKEIVRELKNQQYLVEVTEEE